MSKKNKQFIKELKKNRNLPLSLYLLEETESTGKTLRKISKSKNLNTEGYVVGTTFYKPISKF